MRVLVIEYEPIIRMDLAFLVGSMGHAVVGPFSDEDEAIAAIEESRPDAALLDYILGGKTTSERCADILTGARVPFAFVTGHQRNLLPARFADIPVIAKPFDMTVLYGFLSQTEWQRA
ncbi:MAG: response regulator [Rhizobiaceae bacterium]|nr:response regulator [Rhizobiaceae bacterium]